MADDNQNSQQAENAAPPAENNTNDENENTNNESQASSSETNDVSTDEKLEAEKAKELKLLQERNKQLEEQLKGKSTYLPPEDKDKKLTDECNKFLEPAGLKI